MDLEIPPSQRIAQLKRTRTDCYQPEEHMCSENELIPVVLGCSFFDQYAGSRLSEIMPAHDKHTHGTYKEKSDGEFFIHVPNLAALNVLCCQMWSLTSFWDEWKANVVNNKVWGNCQALNS